MRVDLRAASHQFLAVDASATFDFSAVWDPYTSEARLAAFPGGLLVVSVTDGIVTVEVDARAEAPGAAVPEGDWTHVTTAGLSLPSGRLELMGVLDAEPVAVAELPAGEYAVEARFDDDALPHGRSVLVVWPQPGAGQNVRVPLQHRAQALRRREQAWRSRVEAAFPGRDAEVFVWELGPLRARFPHVRTLRLAPSAAEADWLYVSVGAWALPPGSSESPEFAVRSARDDLLLAELLAMLAYRQSVEGPLAAGAALAIGRPWLEGSRADHVLLADAPALGVAGELEMLAVVPLYAAEARWAGRHGADALLGRVADPRVFADPDRGPIV